MRTHRAVLLCVCLVGGLGCGEGSEGGPTGPAGPGSPTDNEGEVGGVETGLEPPYVQPGPWIGMTKAQRFEFMSQVVVPEMGALFREFDPEKYADFGCRTCHGQDAGAVEFTMPNGIAPLDLAEFPLTESVGADVAATAEFMAQVVAPTMGELLELPPFSADNRQGFGCFSCHGREED